MAGNATLDSSLIDDLVPVIDDLRQNVVAGLGLRSYRVYSVIRSYQGDQIGDGPFTDVETEILPPPRVKVWDGFKFVLNPVGLDQDGEIVVDEISLTYTYADLFGSSLTAAQQAFIKVVPAHGQGGPSRYFTPSRPAFIDREKSIGWVLWLKNASVPGCGG